MQTETNSTVSHKTFFLLSGYNLPFLLWTVYAVQKAFWGGLAFWQCPVHKVFGWCPGCGLTTAYVQFLETGTVQNVFFVIVFAVFVLNLLFSLRKALLLKHGKSETR
ncbi:MAG: DUF2752 domain-containing protein [Chitinispirillaceae bacterium]